MVTKDPLQEDVDLPMDVDVPKEVEIKDIKAVIMLEIIADEIPVEEPPKVVTEPNLHATMVQETSTIHSQGYIDVEEIHDLHVTQLLNNGDMVVLVYALA